MSNLGTTELMLREHRDDAEMLELISQNDRGFITVWGIVHSDMIDAIEGGREMWIAHVEYGASLKVGLQSE